MWDKLRRDAEVNLQALQKALGESTFERSRLLEVPENESPPLWDLRAAAWLLHECYTGVENTLKLVAVAVDGGLPAGEHWHVKLLDQMALAGPNRPAAISTNLARSLRDFLAFRHVARSHYGHDLDWARLKPLIEQLPKTMDAFETELRSFLTSLG